MRGRTLLMAAAALLALSACRREPDFDERYDAASAKISQAAADIDAQIAGTGAPPTEATTE